MLRLPTTAEVFSVLTLIFAALVLLALTKPASFRFLRDKGSDFPSLQRQGYYVGQITMTWGFMWQVANNQLSDWYAFAYISVLTGSEAYSKYLAKKANDPPAPLNHHKGVS